MSRKRVQDALGNAGCVQSSFLAKVSLRPGNLESHVRKVDGQELASGLVNGQDLADDRGKTPWTMLFKSDEDTCPRCHLQDGGPIERFQGVRADNASLNTFSLK